MTKFFYSYRENTLSVVQHNGNYVEISKVVAVVVIQQTEVVNETNLKRS
jgi:hypothetical protein